MNYVEPIRNKEAIRDISSYLKKTCGRNHIMFLIGIYSGLRISDILRLKIYDVQDRYHFEITEQKTGNKRKIPINKVLKKAIDTFCEGKDPDDYLIKSRQGYNKSITRDMAYKIIKDACSKFGIHRVGTHTLRKTFGYHYYHDSGGDIETLRIIFGHSHWSITARYIGITQDTIDDAILAITY